MKAGILYAPNDIRYGEIEKPEVTNDGVLVQVKYTGICGSDIPRVFAGASRQYPNILGHEFSGVVAEVGKNVNNVVVGDHVVGIPLVPCNNCEDCLEGNYALCKNYSFIGSRQYGSMAEFVSLPKENVLKIDKSIDFKEAAFFEPATVALHGIDLLGDIKENCSVAILGGGTIGLLAAQMMKKLGARQIAIIGRRVERLEIARKIGFSHIYSTLNDVYQKELMQLTNQQGFDYVIETSGSEETTKIAFQIVKNKGKVCYIGTPKKEITFSIKEWEYLNRKEATVLGSWMSYSYPFPGTEWNRVAELFRKNDIRVYSEMIDEIYPLSEIKQAFECFQSESGVMGKILINSEL